MVRYTFVDEAGMELRIRLRVVCLVVGLLLSLGFCSASALARAEGENEGYIFVFISDALELKEVADDINNGTLSAPGEYFYYILTDDIDLTDLLSAGGEGYADWGDYGWNPIGYGMGLTGQPIFKGIFDGNGYSISGLWSSGRFTNMSGAGLFGINGGTIKNLTVHADEAKGGISGENKVGGIAGVNSGVIIDCSFYGAVSGDYDIGGIVGVNEKTIENSQNNGTVSAFAHAGGVAGKNMGEIFRCQNTGGITASDLSAGGIAGLNTKDVFECVNDGFIESDGGYAGGIVGYALSGKIDYCVNFGSVFGKTATGGIAGVADDGINYGGVFYDGARISNSFNVGSVEGQGLKAGIANAVDRVVTNCYYDKNTTVAVIDVRNELSTFDMTGLSFLTQLNSGSDKWALRSPDNYHYYPELTAFFSGNPENEIQALSRQAAQSLLPAYKGMPVLSITSLVYGTPLFEITFAADEAGVFSWSEPYSILNAGSGVVAYAKFEPFDESFGELNNIEISLTVEKAAVALSVSMDGWKAGKATNEPSAEIIQVIPSNSNSLITFSYKKRGAADSEYSATVPTKAGKYVVRAVMAESQNYLSATATAEFEIKADLTWFYVCVIVLAIFMAVYFTNKRFKYFEKAYATFKPKTIVKEVIVEKPVEVIKVVNANDKARKELEASLTRRELEVALKILDGKSRQEIASELFIGERTVMTHIENILSKTYCPNQRVFIAKYK